VDSKRFKDVVPICHSFTLDSHTQKTTFTLHDIAKAEDFRRPSFHKGTGYLTRKWLTHLSIVILISVLWAYVSMAPKAFANISFSMKNKKGDFEKLYNSEEKQKNEQYLCWLLLRGLTILLLAPTARCRPDLQMSILLFST
jgi:hypothetical protein